jgi:hypothetical protein
VRALEVRSAQLLGRSLKVYWDPSLEDKAPFAERPLQQLHDVTAFVPIVSNHYAESKWAARELAEFCDAAQSNGGGHVQSRVFKVMKSPVSAARLPRELQSVVGYEFFTLDPESGKVREFRVGRCDSRNGVMSPSARASGEIATIPQLRCRWRKDMKEVLVVLHPSISRPEREAVARVAPPKGSISDDVFIADYAGDRLQELRAMRGVAHVLTGGETADGLPQMTDAETLFVQAWLSARGAVKSRRGEGLDWDTPPMVPPDRPR